MISVFMIYTSLHCVVFLPFGSALNYKELWLYSCAYIDSVFVQDYTTGKTRSNSP